MNDFVNKVLLAFPLGKLQTHLSRHRRLTESHPELSTSAQAILACFLVNGEF